MARHFDRVLGTKGFATLPKQLQEEILAEIQRSFVSEVLSYMCGREQHNYLKSDFCSNIIFPKLLKFKIFYWFVLHFQEITYLKHSAKQWKHLQKGPGRVCPEPFS